MRTDHAGFDLVLLTVGDGAGPGLDDTLAIPLLEAGEPGESAAGGFHGDADVVEEALVGVGNLAGRIAHPDGLGVKVGQDAVALFGGGEPLFVPLAAGDVHRKAAQMGRDAGFVIYRDTAALDPADLSLATDHAVV